MMHIIERQKHLEQLVEEWINKTERPEWTLPPFRFHWGLTVPETVDKLREIQNNGVTQGAIDALFHASNWGILTCDECNQDKDILVHYGSEPDYNLQWQDICEDCLRKGIYCIAAIKANI